MDEQLYEELLYPGANNHVDPNPANGGGGGAAAAVLEKRRPPIALPQDANFDCNVNVLNGYTVHDVYSVDFDGESLGDGGYGTVFLGHHLYEIDMPVAIKKISFGVMRRGYDDVDDDDNGDLDGGINGGGGLLEFRRLVASMESQISEIVILKMFRNDYRMVHLHEFFVSMEQNTRITSLYIVTEFLPGGELFDCIKNRIKTHLEQQQQQQQHNQTTTTTTAQQQEVVSSQPFCEGDVRNIFRVLLEAINFLQQHNVVHRDLKPSNLLLQVRDRPTSLKVADFGQSKELAPGETTRTSCGTPGYRSPEMYQGESYRESVDLFSAGCILFFLLAGYQPFASYPKHKIRHKTVRCEYRTNVESWNRVSSSAKSLVKSLLASADLRISAKAALNHPWMLEDDQAAILKTDLTENVKSIVVSLEMEHERSADRVAQTKLGVSRTSIIPSLNRSVPVVPTMVPDFMDVVEEPMNVTTTSDPTAITSPVPVVPSTLVGTPTIPTEPPVVQVASNQHHHHPAAAAAAHAVVKEDVATPEVQGGCCSCLFGTRASSSVVPAAAPPPPQPPTPSVQPSGRAISVVSGSNNENGTVEQLQIVPPTTQDTLPTTRLETTLDFQHSSGDGISHIINMEAGLPESAIFLVDYITEHVHASHYTEAIARMYIRKLIETVALLHENNIAHRNLSISNFLANKETGDVILNDMRYACDTIPGVDSLSGYCGTPYVTTAPEVYTDFSYNEKVVSHNNFLLPHLLRGLVDS